MSILLALVIAPLLLLSSSTQSSEVNRPNIVFFFADDWGRDAGCYASPACPSPSDLVKTPNIDQVAREGVRFNNAFYDCPLCTPSRASIVSGCYFWRCGASALLGGNEWHGKEADPFIDLPRFPHLLADAGYATAKAFKTLSFKPTLKNVSIDGIRSYVRYGLHVSSGETPEDRELRRQEVINQTRESIRRVLAECSEGTPFFFVYGPINTHRPYAAGSGQALWGISSDSLKGKLPAYLPDVPEVRTDLADYLGEVQALDLMVGIFLEELKKTGQADNTILVLSGDNGAPGFTHGKTQLYDLGSRAPLIIRWPNHVRAGRTVDDFVTLKDLAPTFLEAAGVHPPATMDARSLMPLLVAEKNGLIDTNRNAAIFGRERHYRAARSGNLPYPSRAIRTKDFLFIRNFTPNRWPFGDPFGIGFNPEQEAKVSGEYSRLADAPFRDMDASLTKAWLILHREDSVGRSYYDLAFGKRPAEELYDMGKDPHQMNNVKDDPACVDTLAKLREQLLNELKANNDPRLDNDAFDREPYLRLNQ